MAKRKPIHIDDETNSKFMKMLTERKKQYKKPDKKPSLADFLKQDEIFKSIYNMTEQGLPWTEIASVFNETHSTNLKPTTISATFALIAKEKGKSLRERRKENKSNILEKTTSPTNDKKI